MIHIKKSLFSILALTLFFCGESPKAKLENGKLSIIKAENCPEKHAVESINSKSICLAKFLVELSNEVNISGSSVSSASGMLTSICGNDGKCKAENVLLILGSEVSSKYLIEQGIEGNKISNNLIERYCGNGSKFCAEKEVEKIRARSSEILNTEQISKLCKLSLKCSEEFGTFEDCKKHLNGKTLNEDAEKALKLAEKMICPSGNSENEAMDRCQTFKSDYQDCKMADGNPGKIYFEKSNTGSFEWTSCQVRDCKNSEYIITDLNIKSAVLYRGELEEIVKAHEQLLKKFLKPDCKRELICDQNYSIVKVDKMDSFCKLSDLNKDIDKEKLGCDDVFFKKNKALMHICHPERMQCNFDGFCGLKVWSEELGSYGECQSP